MSSEATTEILPPWFAVTHLPDVSTSVFEQFLKFTSCQLALPTLQAANQHPPRPIMGALNTKPDERQTELGHHGLPVSLPQTS